MNRKNIENQLANYGKKVTRFVSDSIYFPLFFIWFVVSIFWTTNGFTEASTGISEDLIPVGFPEETVKSYQYLTHPFYEYGAFGVGFNVTSWQDHGSLFSIEYSRVTDKSIGYISRIKFDWPWKFWADSEEFWGWEEDMSWFSGDRLDERRLAGAVLDGGVTYGIGPNLHLLSGAGIAYHKTLHRYEDNEGYYWAGVPGDYLDFNLFFGFGIRHGDLVYRATWTRIPRGINLTVGIGG